MNLPALYNYISELFQTHVRTFDKNAGLLGLYTVRNDLHDEFADSCEIIRSICSLPKLPQLYAINNLLTYFCVPLDSIYCVVGPVSVCADCRQKIQFPALIIPNELVGNLYTTNSSHLIRAAVFLYNLFAEIPVDTYTCYSQNCIGADITDNSLKEVTKSLFNHEEYGVKHNSYEAEKREMHCIETGNLKLLHECWEKESPAENIGTLSENSLRNAKYLSIINIALTSRAAIRGGVPYELAYSLCDAYGQQIDRLNESNLPQIEGIVRNIQLTYTQLVAQQRGNSAEHSSDNSPLITHAKDFIFSHLHGKLTVNDVAEALNTHPNYLNRIFKQSEGITIYDYILREKMKLICNMLTYSEYSYIEIANYFGFASQSHLGNKFKKYTGMTLKQYRDAYHKISD